METITFYMEDIEINKSDYARYKALYEEIDFDTNDKIMLDKIEQLSARTNDEIFIGGCEFKNGSKLSLYLCSGNSNYWVDSFLLDKNGNIIDDSAWEMAFVDDYMYLDGNYVYKAKIKVVD